MSEAMSLVYGDAAPAKAKKIPLTDLGNAERFAAQHGENVRWVPAWNTWLIWDGKRWERDDTLEIERLAKLTVRSIGKMAFEEGGEMRKGMAMHAIGSEKSTRLKAMLTLARAEAGIAITPSQLDAHPWLLSVENGTVDLRTGKLQEHNRDDLITKVVPVPYDPDAPCTRWEAFLSRVLAGDESLIRFVQRAVGYSITGLTTARLLFFLYGSGANGKSTFLEIIRQLLAGYASQADFTTFLERKGDGPRNDIARLFSARVVTSSEVGEGKRLNESLMKTLTGDETITARFLHAEFFEFKPTFKLWLAANHRPVVRGTDNAIWDRIRLIPFTVSIPVEERDPGLRDALIAELPGILTWAIGGCILWQRDGLTAPAAVDQASAAYRRDSDVLGAFLEDCCDLGDTFECPSTLLYASYARWCDDSGEFKRTQTAFGTALEERGIHAIKRGGKKYRVGISLKYDFPTPVAPVSLARSVREQEEMAV